MGTRLEIRYCPVCGEEFDEETEIFIGPDGIVGCENCVTSSYPHIIDEDLDERAKIRWANEQFNSIHEMGGFSWQR